MSGPNNINRSSTVDPYNNMDDWLNEDLDSALLEEGGDFSEDYESGYQSGAQGRPSIALTGTAAAEQLKTLYNQIKKDPEIDVTTKNKQLKELRALFDQAKSFGNKPVSNALMNEISALEAGSISDASIDGMEDEEGGSGNLKEDLASFKTQIQSNTSLSAAKKQQYLAKIDQWISGMDLRTLDADTIQPLFDEMRTQITQASAFSPAIQSIAEATNADPEEIQSAFEAKGLNPSSLPNPPTQKVLEVLVSLSDELGSKLQAVKDTVRARSDEIQKQTNAANAQNAANTACTSDNDNTDLKAFQYLYDAKYQQDTFSKDVASAMREASGELATLLQAAYPGTNISTVPASEGQGFNETQKDYYSAGLINFNGAKIDLFKANDGSLQASSSIDTGAEVQIVTVKYDWEGGGDWEDRAGAPSLNTYGDQIQKTTYDTGW